MRRALLGAPFYVSQAVPTLLEYCPDIDKDIFAFTRNCQIADRFHRRFRLTQAGAETGEIMLPDQNFPGLIHRLFIQRHLEMPAAASIVKGGRRLMMR